MKSCCSSNSYDKRCIRKSDGKVFELPRRFSKKRCKQSIKGFTMRSSCAPYKDCLTKKGKRKKVKQKKDKRKKDKRLKGGQLTFKKNMLGKKIKVCSKNPMTGFYRDGYCMTGLDDSGTHTVCAKMDKKFLDYTAKKGNDLSSVVEPRDKWCLCEYRWQEAFKDGVAPEVVQNATNMRTKDVIRKQIIEHSKDRKSKRSLPKLRQIDKSKKEHIYKLSDPHKKRILAIDEGIRDEMRKGVSRRQAALSKKKRFNVLRLYRKNNDPKGCKRLTQDMKYMDKKYDTGQTNNICK